MSPADRQQQLVESLLQFEDAQERLAFVQDRVRKRPPLGAEHRTESHRVPGCVTRVWLLPSLHEGRCWFEVDSESQMVRGLAALVVDCFNGATTSEVVCFECSLLEAAGLDRRVTPTRLHGLAQVQAAVKSFARANL